MEDDGNENNSSWNVWHRRLCHVNDEDLRTMTKNIKVTGGPNGRACKGCAQGKMTGGHFPKRSENKAKSPLDIVSSDIKGPYPVPGLNGGAIYIITFIDHFTRFLRVYFLRRKSEALSALKQFQQEAFIRTGNLIHRINILQTDNAGEYTSNECRRYYMEQGIFHRTSVDI